MRFHEIGAQADSFRERRRRVGVPRLLEEGAAELGVRRRAPGRERHRAAKRGLRLVGAALTAQGEAEPHVRRGIIGPASERLAERRLGVAPAPLRGERARPVEERGDLAGHPGNTAVASISTSRSSRTRREISTSVLAGRCAPKYS